MHQCRISVAVVLLLVAGRGAAIGQCYPETFGANAFDGTPDSAAIQACLDQGGTTLLTYNPDGGYIIDSTLELNWNDTILTSTTGDRARLIAHTMLLGPILRTAAVSGYQIFNLDFNGNKFQRFYSYACWGYRDFGTNLQLRGSYFSVHHIDSTRAMCGSGMEVLGDHFEIYENWIGYNGRSADEGLIGEQWADGITLLSCDSGSVHDNWLDNNTDIDLVVGGGSGCSIQWNHIRHTPTRGVAVYGFAGIHVGYFQEGGGNHSGSTVAYNDVSSDLDKLSFGIIVGFHPWGDQWVTDAGSVVSNTTTGSVVPLAIDGIVNGSVQANVFGGHRGTNGWGSCSLSADYTAGDFGNASIQNGWVWRTYHGGGCQ